ncbi:MAG: sigma-54-dependent Fis family transcriptional regulator [Deltaproteobacteria bacterium]|nr:MAG: sigma-54-dependent Fis family transcriptional regulator [Deltaproteobacteria bacterium]
MLEDYNFLHQGLEDQASSIYVVLNDFHASGMIKESLEQAFALNVFKFEDSSVFWQNFKAPRGLFLLITEDSFAGMELIEKLKRKNLSFKTILASASPRAGDHLSLQKPISHNSLKGVVGNIFGLTDRADIKENFLGLVGGPGPMQEVFNLIKNNCSGPKPILITGPRGSGKSSVAQAILKNFDLSSWEYINCSTATQEVLENELFGPEDGKLARDGMIFLKDIEKLPLLLQAKLSKFLKNEQGLVKLLASTSRDLIDLVSSGDFRKDLLGFFGQKIGLPPLFERKEDLPLLIKHFGEKYSRVHGCESVEFDESSLEILANYDWPENVYELEILIEKLVLLHTGSLITPSHLTENFFKGEVFGSVPYSLPEKGIDLRGLLRDIEDSLIKQALEKTGGNKNRASKLLQINRTTLVEKLKKRKRESNNQVT